MVGHKFGEFAAVYIGPNKAQDAVRGYEQSYGFALTHCTCSWHLITACLCLQQPRRNDVRVPLLYTTAVDSAEDSAKVVRGWLVKQSR